MRWLFSRAVSAGIDRSDWIDEAGWQALIANEAYLARLDDDAFRRLRRLCGDFVATKAINGAGGLDVTDAMIGRIATQACLPILELGLAAYPSFEEIVVYPADFIVEREIVDQDGVVHAWSEPVAGESWEDGPVVLAWDATERSAKDQRPSPFAFNVVIHEFAHKLDMTNGAVDGMPAFSRTLHPGLDPSRWLQLLHAALGDFIVRLEAVERSIPRHVDPDSARADRFYAALPIDAYAATDEGEFFSVSSEAFFVTPQSLKDVYPNWYALLAAYYRQDPLA
ncbi:MAG: M90 family metallopeptidase [Burkholderiaceae bacterium]